MPLDRFYYPITLGIRRIKSAEIQPQAQTRPRPSTPETWEVWLEGVLGTPAEYEEHRERRVLEGLRFVVPDGAQHFWVILGEPGAGKTTLLEAWFDRWASDLPQPRLGLSVPVLIRLRELKPKDIEKDHETLADQLWQQGVQSSVLLERRIEEVYSSRHRFAFWPVWLLDGLDEVAPSLQGERLYRQLAKLPGAKVITSRTAVFESLRPELEKYEQRTREYEILGLKPREQQIFLAGALEALGREPESAPQLYRQIRQNPAVEQLAGNPLMLRLIAEVSDKMTLPATRAVFYREAIEAMWSRKLMDSRAELDLLEERDRVLIELAQKMSLEEIEHPRLSLIQVSRNVAAEKAELLRGALERAGLVRVDRRRARFSFLHLTLQEFYLARSLEPKELQQVLEQFWDKPRYEETLALLISLLFEFGRVEEIDRSISWLIDWGRETHRRDPEILWHKRRSPLRVVLHLLRRAGLALAELNQTGSYVSKMNGSADLCKIAIASDSSPPELLAQLARDIDVHVRIKVAGNVASSLEVLAQLARDANDSVRRWVAGNGASPDEVLAQLARDANNTVRVWVAANAASPPEVLAQLARDADKTVRLSVARNAASPPHVLQQLAREAVARDAEGGVRGHVAANAASPPELLAQLARDENKDVRRWVAANAASPPELLAQLALDADNFVRRWVATNSTSSPELLTQLARDADIFVRMGVAANAASPPELLARLVYEVNTAPENFAANAASPPEVLAQLAGNADRDVRWRVARNSASPPEVLARLACDTDGDVREAVARNAASPPDVMARLAHDAETTVRISVAASAVSPPEVLAHLARNVDKDVRWNVACNNKTLLEDLVV